MARKILTDFEISEISAVDLPAQKGARAVIMKRRGGGLAKRRHLLTSVDGHSHILAEEDFDGRPLDAGTTSYSVSEGAEHGHEHPWIRLEDGTIEIGEAEGHTHDIQATTKRAGEGDDPMPKTPEEIQKELDAKQAELDKAQADHKAELEKRDEELALAKAKAAMTDDEKKMLDGMKDEDEKKKFALMDPAERRKMLAKAAEADPVVYTAADGTEYRKSDQRLAELAKRADEQEKRLAKAQAEAEDARIEKRVSGEFGALPKPRGVAAILKALGSIEDEEVRKEAEEILKGANEAMDRLTKALGHKGGESDPAVAKAAGDFEAKVAEIKKRDECGHMEAMQKARREHPELFKAYRGEKPEEAAAA